MARQSKKETEVAEETGKQPEMAEEMPKGNNIPEPEQKPQADIVPGSEQNAENGPESPAETAVGQDPQKAEMPLSEKLESLSALASRHRVPSWQQAALLRFMNWQDDKVVTDQEFAEALELLQRRRIGGGRM